MFDLQGDADFLASVDGDIDGVLAWFFEFQLLDVDDEIAHQEVEFGRDGDLDGHVDGRHDEFAVFVHEIHPDFVGAFLDAAEGNSQGNRALGMHRGELLGHDGVESPEDVQLAIVISGGVAKNCNLDIHEMVKTVRTWCEARGAAKLFNL
jgi:hypothetical protein